MTVFLLPTSIVACLALGLALLPAGREARGEGRALLTRPASERAAAPLTGPGVLCFISIEGTKQGVFKSEVARKGAERFAGLRASYELTSPRDLATGQASGKRQHKPLSFVKELGPASPQLFNACATNEVLKTVTLEFDKSNATGEESIYFTIKLTNATVSDIRYLTEDGKELEEVSLTFQKIEVASTVGKTSGADDWSAK